MIKVFVSSVSRGLEVTRREIIDDLRKGRYRVSNMEAFGARPDRPLEVCLQELRTVDVAIVIIGPNYGSLIPSGDVSYTHEEFREARRRDIPVLAFRIADAPDLDEQGRQHLRRFTEEVGEVLTYEETTAERLSAAIQASLAAARDRGELGPRYRVFQTYKQFFALQLGEPGSTQRLFNHLGPFVGRREELRLLLNFVHSNDPVFVLVAPGGSGKSRLLLEMAKSLEETPEQSPRVLFLDAGACWSADDIATLPGAPTICVVDDAHRRPDLDRLISACLQQNANMRFVVSCRPGALPIVQPHVAGLLPVGGDSAQLALQPLAKADAIELARTCLGGPHAHLAERLVGVANLNPLVICVGAACIGARQVAPEILDHAPEEFRRLVLDRLVDDPALAGDKEGLRRPLLELIAAIGPVSAESEPLMKRIASFVNKAPHETRPELAFLESAGLLQRRGRVVRVTPDVLADHLLYQRAIAVNGKNTGYIEAVVGHFSPDLLGNVLANASELDWRGTESGKHERVLVTTWEAIRGALPDASCRQRVELLGQVRQAVVFATEEVFRIVEWLCDHCEASPDGPVAESGGEYDSEGINDALGDLLGHIATHPDFTARCIRRLWRFAEHDDRPTNVHPNHPRRKIQGLLTYSSRLNVRVQREATRFVSDYLLDAGRASDLPWAVELLGEVLDREGRDERITKRSFTIGSFALAPFVERIAGRRREVLDCLTSVANGCRVREAVQAVREMGKLCRKPLGLFNRQVEQTETAAWLPEAQDAVKRLAEIAGTAPLDIVRYAARHELRSAPCGHWPELAGAVDTALKNAPGVRLEQLFDILWGIPREEEPCDWVREQEQLKALSEKAGAELWHDFGSADAVVRALLCFVSEVRAVCQIDVGNLSVLVRSLVSMRPDAARDVVHALAREHDDHATRLVPNALFGVSLAMGHAAAILVVRELAASGDALLRACLADSLRSLMSAEQCTVADLEICEPFVADVSPMVRCAIILPLVSFSKTAPLAALGALLRIDWSNDASIAMGVCGALNAAHGLDPELLCDDQIQQLLDRVEQLVNLDQNAHGILEFISFASTRLPSQTVRMLLRRVLATDESARKDDDKWTPIPYEAHWWTLSGSAVEPVRAGLARQVRDSFHGAGSVARFWLAKLFRVVTGGSATACAVLREWLESGDANNIAAAACLLRGFDHGVVFGEHAFVADLLDAAAKAGPECLQRARDELFAVAEGGGYWYGAGQPAPRHLSDKAAAGNLVHTYRSRPVAKEFFESRVQRAEQNIRCERVEWEETGEDE